MSSFAAVRLQQAVFDALHASPDLPGQVAGIYDRAPQGAAMPHVAFGDTSEQAEDTKSHAGRRVTFEVIVTTGTLGQLATKEIMASIDAVLHLAPLPVEDWSLVTLQLANARVTPLRNDTETSLETITEGRMTYRALLFKSSSSS